MKRNIYSLAISLLIAFTVSSCSYFSKIRSLEKVIVKDIFVVYDTSTLRIPGHSVRIGIGVIARLKDSNQQHNDTLLFTKGLKKGSLNWSNFDIKTFGCNYSNGKLEIYKENWPNKGNIALDVHTKTNPQKSCYISIPKNYITQTQLVAQNTFHKAPGNKIKIGVIKTYDNWHTEILTRKSEVDNYLSGCKLYVTGGYYNKGYFTIDNDIFNIQYHTAGIIAVPVAAPSLADTLSFQLDYIHKYEVNVRATSGFSGFAGTKGNSGAAGGCNGCDGYDGYDGGDGQHGEPGEPGHDLAVDLDTYFDTILKTDLCMVRIEDLVNSQTKVYLVNPKGGSVNITSYGGNGGCGGDGGSGGDGGGGANGETRIMERRYTVTYADSTGTHTKEEVETYTVTNGGGRGGNGGNGGYGGNGGDGGDGGNIYIYYNDESYPYLNTIIAKSYAGGGGCGGSGGSAGSGGTGGNGNPSGASGSSGFRGVSGWPGYAGHDGKIIYTQKQTK